MEPSIGRVVHYVARGSADGVFPPVCRAADVTEVGEGGTVGLMVKNPTGLFFHSLASGGVEADVTGTNKVPGSWHDPRTCEA